MSVEEPVIPPEELARARASVTAKLVRLRRRRRLRRVGVGVVAVVALIAVSARLLQPTHENGAVTVPAPVTSGPPPTAAAPSAPSCIPRGQATQTVAYVSYHLGGAQWSYYIAAVSLPSGQIRWTTAIPDEAAVDAIAVTPGGETVYTVVSSQLATAPGTVELLPIQAGSGSVGQPLEVPGPAPEPEGLAISPDGHTAVVAQSGAIAIGQGPIGDHVTVVDLVDHAVTANIAVGSAPAGAAFSGDGRSAYVTSRDGLRVIDLSRHVVVATIPLLDKGRLVVTGAGRALTAPQGHDLMFPVAVIDEADLRTLHPDQSVALNGPPEQIAVTCDGTTAFAITTSQATNAAIGPQVTLDRIALATRTVSPLENLGMTSLVSLAESPTHDLIWAVTATQACTPTSCPTRFTRLDDSSTAAVTVTLPTDVEMVALGPANVGTP